MFALVLSGLYFTCCSDVAVSGKNHYEGPIDTAMLKIHVSDYFGSLTAVSRYTAHRLWPMMVRLLRYSALNEAA